MSTSLTRPIEIIIACHSPQRPVGRAVASVLDDNGDVASVTLVCHNVDRAAIAAQIPGRLRGRVKFLELNDGILSPTGPFMFGLEHATAEWVGIMGSDDVYEPGALSRLRSLSSGVDAVVPRLKHDSGAPVRTPAVRPGHRARRDAVRDRLFYRSAPLGIIRRGAFKEFNLALEPGLRVGEDLQMSAQLWSRGVIAVQRTGPGYVIGSDASDRVTMALSPIADELQHVSSVWNEEFLSQFDSAHRTALATKYLRIHLFGAAFYRAQQSHWNDGDRLALARSAQTILSFAPNAANPLSRADRKLLDAILDTGVNDSVVSRLAIQRRQFRSPAALIPRRLRYFLHREAPLRFMIASALVR